MAGSTLKVAVIGGGIGGVATGLFLHRAGIRAHIFERADEHREVGYGLQISPNAVRLLERLGLGPALNAVSSTPEIHWQFHKWRNGEVIFEQPIDDAHRARWGAPYYLLRRSNLLRILAEKFPADRLHLNQTVTAVSDGPNSATVHLEGGERAEFDVVIAAEGARSAVRTQVFGYVQPTYSGYYSFRALGNMADTPIPERPATMGIWIGPDRHFVHYPLDRNATLNLVCGIPAATWDYPTSWAEGTVEEFREAFEGWDPRVDQMIAGMTSTRKFAQFSSSEYPAWVSGRVALLGDAAHPMLSFFAQGASQAIEDGAILARALEFAGPNDVADALRAYETVRKPRASAIQADANGRMVGYHFPDGPEQEARDARLRAADPLTANSWVYDHDVEAEWAAYERDEGLDADRQVGRVRI